MKSRLPFIVVLMFSMIGSTSLAVAQESGGGVFADANEAARKTANPLGGDFIIFLTQWDNYFLDGDITDETRNINTVAIQPVIPIPMEALGENWIMVNRPTFPVIMNADLPMLPGIDLSGGGPPEIPSSLPPMIPPGGLPFGDESGFGDIVMFNLLGQSIPTERWGGGDFVWGLGPTWAFPSASDEDIGSGKYQVGPAAVGAFIGKKFIVGGLFQHWESIASGGKGSGNPVAFSWLNLFYFWNLENGWQVGGTPVITADWEADDDQRWTVPIGVGVYKTHFFGKMPIKMGVEMQYMPVRPDAYGQHFNIRLTFAPVFPSPFGSL
jgi:hypothetical protein